jgi:glycosyltransferase involved in cell wall biosynthesis
MKKISYCMVVNSLDVGGLEKIVVSLLNNIDREKYEPHLICLDAVGTLFSEVNISPDNVLVFNKLKHARRFGPLQFDPSIIISMRRYFIERKIDIVHSHNAAPLIYAGIAAKICPRGPIVVYSEHNQIYSATGKSKFKFRYYLKLADQVITVSRDLQMTLTRLFGTRCPIRVIHNGIDGSRFTDVDGSRVREELGVEKDDFLIGTGVVISKQKGLIHLIDAAREIVGEDPKIRFAIAGDGPLRKDLQKYVAQEGLEDRINFLGYRRDIPEFISALDLYVLPSLWEGLPLALLEALAIGKPIIATRVGGNPEIVEDGVNGYIVPAGDSVALSRRIRDVRRDPNFGMKAREANLTKFAQQFSLESMVRAHEDLFLDLMTKHAHPHDYENR